MRLPKVVISQEGTWPDRWSWEATILVQSVPDGATPRYSDTFTMRGGAMTKKRALMKAHRAIKTVQVNPL